MTEIPNQPEMTAEQAQQRLSEWFQKQAQLKTLKTHEYLERLALVAFFFPSPVEGTNRRDIGLGFDLKLKHGFNFKALEEELDQVKPADIKRLKLPWDELFVYKPELSISVYRTLSAEQKKFVDGLLEIKEASPALEIVARAADSQPQVADAQDLPRLRIVENAEDATPGSYYGDGGSWWVLSEAGEWDAIEDPEMLRDLGDIRAGMISAANAHKVPKVRRGRKPKGG